MEGVQEIVFQVLLSRMIKKSSYSRPLLEPEVIDLIDRAREVLSYEPVLLEISSDIVIVGDIHGNIDDLIRIFERLKYPPATRYLFLGDYVDRGQNSVEVMLLLFSLKIMYPDSVYLLRGNHEGESLTSVYGFQQEVMDKYGNDVYYAFIDAFYELPMCAVVGSKIFCVHGGISPSLYSLDTLRNASKPMEIGLNGVFSDLVWSDPDINVEGFGESHRGCGYLFGSESLEQFLLNNDLDILIRSHEACDEGVAWPFADSELHADTCVTIFSNTDYCMKQNKGSVLCVSEDLTVTIEIFEPTYTEFFQKMVFPIWLAPYVATKEKSDTKKVVKLSENNNENIGECVSI